jgi:hypothetical protein
MKRSFILLLSFCFIIFISCKYSKGVKKDLSTHLTTTYNGFTLADIYLANTNETRLNSNKIPLGSKIFLIATGVENFEITESKVFPGCRMILTDKNKKEILNLPDAFSEMTNGTSTTEAHTLKAALITGEPMVLGETYHLNVCFFDKNNKENEIISDVDLLMKE